MLKKFVNISLIIAVVLSMTYLSIAAEYDKDQLMVLTAGVEMRLAPSADSEPLKIDDEIQYFKINTIYDIEEEVQVGEDVWFGIYADEDTLLTKVYVNKENVELLDMKFEKQMKAQNFPADYVDKLRELHKLHPEWNFMAFHCGIKWDTMVEKESAFRKNLVSGSNIYLRSTAEGCYDPQTGKFIPLDGSNWYQANSETIAYYMDPRNFLNETNIFMFLHLAYNENETKSHVQKILDNTFMQGNDPVDGVAYADIFLQAGINNNVSPIYLATLARQESGTTGNKATTGEAFTYNGKTYRGLYNFFNIGAYSGTDAWKKGLIYANGGEDGSGTSYGRPWTSPLKAIFGGAEWICTGYINRGQDTMYLQKFNCTATSTFNHQYMQNVQAAYSQSGIMYNTYKKNDSLDLGLNFRIPVYLDMCEKTELPTSIHYPGEEPDPTPDPDPNPGNGYTGDIILDLDLLNTDGYLSGFQLGTTYQQLKDKIKNINPDATLQIQADGKEIAGNDVLATGQKFIYTTEEGSSNYTIVIKGDLSGDGQISTVDYLFYRRTILRMQNLEGAYLRAAYFSGESTISTRGYLMMRRHLLKLEDIK